MVGTKNVRTPTGAPRGSAGNFCSACKCENAWQRRFCRMCGEGLTTACGKCQFANGISDRFCGGCGDQASLESSVSPRRATKVVPNPRRVAPVVAPMAVAEAPETTSASLAGRLAGLNSSSVKSRQVTPPPPPGGKAVKEEIGQEQVDALFG